MTDMKFLKDFQKQAEKIEDITASALPPAYWFNTGNFALNKIISGTFDNGIPQGRVVGLAGPSGSGKSFVTGNIAKNAQDDGAFVYVIDAENALDDEFMRKIGVDVDDPTKYYYEGVIKISTCIKRVSAFVKGYRAEYGHDNAT